MRGRGEQHVDAGIGDDVGELGGRVRGVHRDREPAGAPAPEQGDDVVGARFAQDTDTRLVEVAAPVEQLRRELGRCRDEIVVGPRPRGVHDREPVAVLDDPLREDHGAHCHRPPGPPVEEPAGERLG
jgi:hypothetical protein